MYATLAYDVFSGSKPVADVRQAIQNVFQTQAKKLDLLAEVLICKVDKTADYLELALALKRVSTDFPNQFEYVFTLHHKGDLLKSNGPFSTSKKDEIVDGD